MFWAVMAAWMLGRLNREETRPGLFCLAQWAVLIVVAIAAVGRVATGDVAAIGPLVCVGVLAFPWPIARRWLIPRGHWRAAAALVRSSGWVWFDDNHGGSLVAAAMAALHVRDRGRAITWIEPRCDNSDVGAAASLLARGLLAEARADRAAARAWIRSVVEFEGEIRPRHARELAVEWCAAEAASRGDWAGVLEVTGEGHGTANSQWLGLVARRVLGTSPAPDDEGLRAGWRRLRDRDRLAPLLECALAVSSEHREEAPPRTCVEPPRHAEEPWQSALQLHARLLAAASPLAADILAVGAAWDRALSETTVERELRGRAAALGSNVDPIATARSDIERDLVDLALRYRVALGSPRSGSDAMIDCVRRRLRSYVLDRLEISADALATRVKLERGLPIHEEWRQWLLLRDEFDSAVALAGEGVRRTAFDIVHSPATALAAWLWNHRGHKVYAHQMFRWLLRQADLVDDDDARRLQRRNVDCGY